MVVRSSCHHQAEADNGRAAINVISDAIKTIRNFILTYLYLVNRELERDFIIIHKLYKVKFNLCRSSLLSRRVCCQKAFGYTEDDGLQLIRTLITLETADLTRTGSTIRLVPSLMALILVISSSNALCASWLDKLKAKLGDTDTKEQVLGNDEVGAGLKEALRVGTETVVANHGKTDGFNLDPQIHISLPSQFNQVKSILGKMGMDSILTDLELGLNRAAEVATPRAKSLFLSAINDMTLDDVMRSYESVPFAPAIDADLSDYVVEKGMDGIFYYLAKEEAAIRQDPLKRTTDILKNVFGN
jgi:hypothetical protein